MLRSVLRPIAAVAALVGLAAYATITLRGPQGLSALAEKRHQIKMLEEENANLLRDITAKKQRIERLKNDTKTQELEIQKRLGRIHSGDTQFKISEPPSSPFSGSNASGATKDWQ
ncbi:MAG: septum formation initiator family protein [Acidobacteriaceae bacterium]|nr:septum formation initiator family protein [Acidobacteriaceae bacterium]